MTHDGDPGRVGRTGRFAQVFSWIGHPLVSIAVTAGIVVAKQMPARTAVLVITALLLSVIFPTALLLVAGVRSGKWQNTEVANRKERRTFYPWAIPFSGFGAFLMYWLGAPIFVLHGAIVMLALFIAAALANFWIRISLHAIFACYCAVIFFQIGTGWGVAAAVIAGVTCWSRIFLARHTLIETVVGIALGLGGGVLALCWPR